MNLLETFSKLVNEDEDDEDEEVRNKILGSLEFLAIKKMTLVCDSFLSGLYEFKILIWMLSQMADLKFFFDNY